MRFLLTLLLCAALAPAQDLALIHARIYPEPNAPAVDKGTIVIRNEWISAIGPSDQIPVPDGVQVIDCAGLTAVAGFWNSHVHFTEPKWENARSAPAAKLEQ